MRKPNGFPCLALGGVAFGILVLAASSCKKASTDTSLVQAFSTVGQIRRQDIQVQYGRVNEPVTFYTIKNGQRRKFLSQSDTIFLVPVSEPRANPQRAWQLQWRSPAGTQMIVGHIERSGDWKFCETDKAHFDYPCDVKFTVPEDLNNAALYNFMVSTLHPQGALVIEYPNRSANPSLGLSETPFPTAINSPLAIDLSEFAGLQINQYNTGTCLYNSTTSMLEWFYSMLQSKRSGQPNKTDFSKIDVLGRLITDPQGPETSALTNANDLGSVLLDRDLPTTEFYSTNSSGFHPAYEIAQSTVASPDFKAKRVPLGFKLLTQSLFFHGRTAGKTTDDEMKKIADFMTTRQVPVHVFAMYSGIWHAVVALGIDVINKKIYIKDSLQRTDIVGTWYDWATYQPLIYGALGAWVDDGSGSTPGLPSTSPTNGHQSGLGGNPASPTSVVPIPSFPDKSPEDSWSLPTGGPLPSIGPSTPFASNAVPSSLPTSALCGVGMVRTWFSLSQCWVFRGDPLGNMRAMARFPLVSGADCNGPYLQKSLPPADLKKINLACQ